MAEVVRVVSHVDRAQTEALAPGLLRSLRLLVGRRFRLQTGAGALKSLGNHTSPDRFGSLRLRLSLVAYGL